MNDERGAIAVLAALTIVILFAAVAFVIDISRLYHERQVLQNAVDFGALAGDDVVVGDDETVFPPDGAGAAARAAPHCDEDLSKVLTDVARRLREVLVAADAVK